MSAVVKLEQLADTADIEIAREQADELYLGELPTAAGAIRACARSAEILPELLQALLKVRTDMQRTDFGSPLELRQYVLRHVERAVAKATQSQAMTHYERAITGADQKLTAKLARAMKS